MKIIFATGNMDKMREIRQIFDMPGVELFSMKEAGIKAEIVEDGRTFAENSEKKALAVWKECGEVVLADDSGLEIDCLGGEPGIYSARYMGEGTSYDIKNRELISRTDAAAPAPRTARFVCDITAVLGDGRILHAEGTMEGEVAKEPAGANGFGYDPILFLPEYGQTSAQIPGEEKNRISHRGKALRAMKDLLLKELEAQP